MVARVDAIAHEDIAVSVVVEIELLYGAHLTKDPEESRGKVRELLAPWTILPIEPTVEEYVRQKARLRGTRKHVADFDLLIGAAAVHHGLIAVTDNLKHFAHLDGLTVENWQR